MTVLTYILSVQPDEFMNSLPGANAFAWIFTGCVVVLCGQHTVSFITGKLSRRRRDIRSVIIIGVNEITMRVAGAFSRAPHADMHMHGYFDDRDANRRPW